jgi:RNA polymerase sigma factor (sigma-70 family)
MEDAILHQLIAGCLKQNRNDRKMLYQMFYAFAMSISVRYTAINHESTAIMNKGFLKIFEELRDYDQGKPFKVWFKKILVYSLVNHYRLNYQMVHADPLDKFSDILPETLAGTEFNADHLLRMVRRLPHAIRISYNLYAIEGYTFEKMAALLKIKVTTAQLNLISARHKLKQMILVHPQML